MQGVPWEPVPGRTGQHIPVAIEVDESMMDEDEEDRERKKEDVAADEQDPEYHVKAHNLHISRKATYKYGTTEGCPACNAINRRGHIVGRTGYNHSNVCRARIKAEMQNDPEYRRFMHKHEWHQDVGGIEILTEEQVKERRHNVSKAINAIEQRARRDTGNLGQQLTHTMFQKLLAKIEVSEVYSPPRVTEMATSMGLRAGWALDITTTDQDGREWDFNQFEMRNRAIRKVLQDKPMVLIGSPMCIAFCQLNHINYAKMSAEEVERRMQYGRKHLEFCVKLYGIQCGAGRYVLHDHPAGASSWQEECIKKLFKKHGVVRVVGDQCRYGLVSTEKGYIGPARKSIGFMTNSPCITAKLNKRCLNTKQNQVHQHDVAGRPPKGGASIPTRTMQSHL